MERRKFLIDIVDSRELKIERDDNHRIDGQNLIAEVNYLDKLLFR